MKLVCTKNTALPEEGTYAGGIYVEVGEIFDGFHRARLGYFIPSLNRWFSIKYFTPLAEVRSIRIDDILNG